MTLYGSYLLLESHMAPKHSHGTFRLSILNIHQPNVDDRQITYTYAEVLNIQTIDRAGCYLRYLNTPLSATVFSHSQG